MKKILKRLKSKRGESLIESMAAILIFTFASILFLSLVNAAADVNLSVRESDELFQAQQQTVESSPSPSLFAAPNAEAVLYSVDEVNDTKTELTTVDMDIVTSEDDGLYTYRVHSGVGS